LEKKNNQIKIDYDTKLIINKIIKILNKKNQL
jgi:hypothetical protein